MTFKADAAKLKRWREERQWSQEHLADLAGIGLRTIQRIENGDQASPESLKALAAAFNVDVMALSVDQDAEAAKLLHNKNEQDRAALRLSFWVHLASYAMSMIIFAGISIGVGGDEYAMLWPSLAWTMAIAAHAAVVVIVEVTSHYKDRYGLTD